MEFKVGDLVKHKSGGPVMLITGFEQFGAGDATELSRRTYRLVRCEWFTTTWRLQRDSFGSDNLEPTP